MTTTSWRRIFSAARLILTLSCRHSRCDAGSDALSHPASVIYLTHKRPWRYLIPPLPFPRFLIFDLFARTKRTRRVRRLISSGWPSSSSWLPRLSLVTQIWAASLRLLPRQDHRHRLSHMSGGALLHFLGIASHLGHPFSRRRVSIKISASSRESVPVSLKYDNIVRFEL